MKTIILTAARDSETGELGLVLPGQVNNGSTNTAAGGLLIAHDLIEHQNGVAAIGSIDDELEALGAIWYVRGQCGELTRDGCGTAHTLHEHLVREVTRMFCDHAEGGQHVDFAGARKWRPVYHDDDLQQIIEAADRNWADEFNTPGEAREHAPAWKAYRDIALSRMRTGYTKARRFWEARYGSYWANNVFWAIADAVHPHAKNCEYEGRQFILRYSCKAATATCEEYYPKE